MEAEQQDTGGQETFFNTVTPLSKYLAMVLFIAMPFIGGWIGYMYAPEKPTENQPDNYAEVAEDTEKFDLHFRPNKDANFLVTIPNAFNEDTVPSEDFWIYTDPLLDTRYAQDHGDQGGNRFYYFGSYGGNYYLSSLETHTTGARDDLYIYNETDKTLVPDIRVEHRKLIEIEDGARIGIAFDESNHVPGTSRLLLLKFDQSGISTTTLIQVESPERFTIPVCHDLGCPQKNFRIEIIKPVGTWENVTHQDMYTAKIDIFRELTEDEQDRIKAGEFINWEEFYLRTEEIVLDI